MLESSNDVITSTAPSCSIDQSPLHQGCLELILSSVALSSLVAELGGHSLERIENDCRLLVKLTVSAVIELGKRLLIIKSFVSHGQWIETIGRIGIEARYASRFMRAAIRVIELGGLPVLTDATDSQSKLFELMRLDDDELKNLDEGQAVRGVTVGSLPEMTVKTLRAALKENAPKKTVYKAPRLLLNDAQTLPPEVAPILGGKPNVETSNDATSHHLESASSTETLDAHGFNVEKETWPAGDSNRATSAGLNPTETYPAVYALLPVDFNGVPVSLISHDGKVWMIAEEVAALLGESPEAVAEMEEIIDSAFDKNFPEGGYTKATLASTSLVMRLLDQRAIRYVCLTLETPVALGLSEWIGADHLPSVEHAAPVPIASAKPAPTLKQCFIEIEFANSQVEKILYLVEAQIKAIRAAIEDRSELSSPEGGHLYSLVEIAEKLIDPFGEMVEQQEDAMGELRKKLFNSADAGDVMPESVWLDLVKELSADHDGGFTNDHMCNLANIVDSMSRFGEHSPEVECAVRQVEALADRNGAVLYDHLYEGEAPGSGRVAFSWKPGMEPQQRRAAEMAH